LERYTAKSEFCPEADTANKIYRTRENQDFCKSKEIRLSDSKLGRSTKEEKEEARNQVYQDSCERNEVKDQFGTGKRKYTLDYVMTKLRETQRINDYIESSGIAS